MEWYPFNINTSAQDIQINATGFYYFIFSNENEMTDNIVVADIELHKTRFNTSRSIDRCEDSTHCELHLEFYSNQHVLIEVPDIVEGGAECESLGYNNFAQCNYVVRAESICHPRGTVYMVFLLLVPVIILLFAYI
ncbi:uncharacterized protein LOC111717079 [Eurytemora carolleeae]|uniref:uncharacterized protein LOC111717079 n=1 Tax=Eurytemora carolleeae TaxID=1294199 RepID=UPI000C7722B9|nr:uncharacterized protein LOC111717079 [Eurytemora carolleeae]|eukprot:XP_023348361.1 uncharacterized protein LOC111717079 [Eurytemora affinis]